MSRTVSALTFVALAVPASALAQAQAAAPQPVADARAAAALSERVEGKKKIRVRTARSWVMLERPVVDTLGIAYLAADGGSNQLLWGQFTDVQVRKSIAPTGAAVGAILFGLGGLAVGVAASRPCSGGFATVELCGLSPGHVVALTLGGAMGGALLGLLFTAPFSKWSTVYRSEPALLARPVVTMNPVTRRVTAAVQLRI
jgi:hypothetical protein